MNSYVHDPSLTPFGTLVVLGLSGHGHGPHLLRLPLPPVPGGRPPFHKLIAGGLIVMVSTDFAHDLLVLHGQPLAPALVDAAS